jgi:hypothetical protein
VGSSNWLKHIYVINVRRGPLDLEHNFTTITIVNSNTNVIMINVYILCDVNIVISWFDFDGTIFIILFINKIDESVKNKNVIIFLAIFLILMYC